MISDLYLVEIDTYIGQKASHVFDHVLVGGVNERPWEFDDRVFTRYDVIVRVWRILRSYDDEGVVFDWFAVADLECEVCSSEIWDLVGDPGIRN